MGSKGKILNQPVYSLLGGPVPQSITCYATSDDLDWSQELGFSPNLRSPTRRTTPTETRIKAVVDHVSQARERVGGEHDLMINPVMSYNFEFPQRGLLEHLGPYNLRWLGETIIFLQTMTASPDYENQHHGSQSLRARTITVATRFLTWLKKRAADILQPDLNWGGGLTEAMKIHTIGEKFLESLPFLTAEPIKPFGQKLRNGSHRIPNGRILVGHRSGGAARRHNPYPRHREPQ
ncbi:MAG: hypothetical protein Ct9H300mP19_15250 [Dehalococcoidia bacterium]|nr:MAG: hypothetical protein Ct9H300mP19_15250 [Dehalococcoidia bacterium]